VHALDSRVDGFCDDGACWDYYMYPVRGLLG
jgi:hypothetical protein